MRLHNENIDEAHFLKEVTQDDYRALYYMLEKTMKENKENKFQMKALKNKVDTLEKQVMSSRFSGRSGD